MNARPVAKPTPYDTGDVLEPFVHVRADGGRERYGWVDFDDDEGSTVVTARITRRGIDSYEVELQPSGGTVISVRQ